MKTGRRRLPTNADGEVTGRLPDHLIIRHPSKPVLERLLRAAIAEFHSPFYLQLPAGKAEWELRTDDDCTRERRERIRRFAADWMRQDHEPQPLGHDHE